MALQCHELFPILLYIVLLVSLALQKTARYNSENTRNIGKKQKNAFFYYARFVLLLFIKNCTTLDWMVCTIKIDQFDLEFLMRPDHTKVHKMHTRHKNLVIHLENKITVPLI